MPETVPDPLKLPQTYTPEQPSYADLLFLP